MENKIKDKIPRTASCAGYFVFVAMCFYLKGIDMAIEKKLFVELCPKMVESATRIAEKIMLRE